MKQYEEYKQSNHQWFDYIPLQWREAKVKHLFSIGRGRVISQQELIEDGLYPVYSSQTKNDGCLGFINTFDFDEQGVLTWTTDGANAGEVFKRSGKFNCTNVCGTLKPIKELNLDYYLYFLKNITPFYKRPDTNGAKIMNNEMAEIYTVIPTLSEQLIIAEYLDYTTGKIDLLISEKERLINKLEEKRKSLINEVVTRGLNPDIQMRDSGIDWLGKIPQHWLITKINRVFNLVGSGTTPTSGNNKYYTDGTINWLNTGDLNDGIISETSKRVTEAAVLDFSALKLFPVYSVVIAMYGATIGKLGLLNIETTTNQACCVLSDSTKISQKYLFYYLYAIRKHIISLAYGGGQPNISQELIKQLPIIQASIDEQAEIVNYIEARTSKLDKLSNEIKTQIEKLKEYKTSVISEAVTGKVDLREWQIPKTN